MTLRVPVKPPLLRWACERSGHDVEAVAARIPQLPRWLNGEVSPTLKQLEAFARVTRTPVGYLFLAEPPVERLPIPDLRTMASARPKRPSADLLEMVYACQRRQAWYRDYAVEAGEPALPFVGSKRLADDAVVVAATIRHALAFDLEARARLPSWTDALRQFIEQAEAAGVMVMCSGVVMNDTSRVLDATEFRGFALADDYAPLVFINGTDTKAAQMFTLAHELAHVWLGQSAVSDGDAAHDPSHEVERWCDRVAAEVLVPLKVFKHEFRPTNPLDPEVARLARMFKVSTLVILRRVHDAGRLTRDAFWRAYGREVERLSSVPRTSGGNFYLTEAARVSKRFARALITSTLEGHTLYRDAFHMLGLSKQATFDKLAQSLHVG